MKYVYLLILVLVSSSASACGCRDKLSLEKAAKLNKYVFIAEVSAPMTITSEGSMITMYYLLNLENLKGTPTSQYYQEEFELKTSCDITLKTGDKWLIFLNTDEPKIDLGGCGSSAPLKYLAWAEKNWKSRVENSNQKSVLDAKDAQHN